MSQLTRFNLLCFIVDFFYKILFFSFTGKRRYNIKLWKTFTDCFNCLPVAAIVDEKIFCCHGGLSPDLQVSHSLHHVRKSLTRLKETISLFNGLQKDNGAYVTLF